MANALADQGIRVYECPACHHLTPYPITIDQPAICVRCLQSDWPDDEPRPNKRNEDDAVRIIIMMAIGGAFVLAVAVVLSRLGYL